MNWIFPILFLFLISPIIGMADPGFNKLINAGESCNYCHSPAETVKENPFVDFKIFKKLPFKKDRSCSYCHVSNLSLKKSKEIPHWVPLDPQKISNLHSFAHVPSIRFQIVHENSTIKRFTKCGLETHLRQPIKRYPNEAAFMYPLTSNHALKILKTLAPYLEPCETFEPSKSKIESGRKLYEKHCQACHGQGPAPVIQLGYPLLSKPYFVFKLKKGSLKKNNSGTPLEWRTQGENLKLKSQQNLPKMPQFEFSRNEIDSLYSFLFLEPNPSENSVRRPKQILKTSSDFELFQFVTSNIFNVSCKHCHSPDTKTQKEILDVFASRSERLPVFPLPNLEISPNMELQTIFTCQKDKQTSPIIERLLERHVEVNGSLTPKKNSEFRGMPLTQAPIPLDYIEKMQEWIQRSCPGPNNQNYCLPCDRKAAIESL